VRARPPSAAGSLDARVALVVLVGLVVLAGCGGGSGEVSQTAGVSKADVAVDTDLSWASCGPVSSSEPDKRPAGDFFSDDAPHEGELVPGSPVAAGWCAPYSDSPLGGRDLELTGSSLDALVNALNHAPRYDGSYDCTSQGGASNRVVFRYDDGRVLPVLLSRDSCGWADNGAQIRYALDVYLSKLDSRLDRATE
jgi:hypothetical protein